MGRNVKCIKYWFLTVTWNNFYYSTWAKLRCLKRSDPMSHCLRGIGTSSAELVCVLWIDSWSDQTMPRHLEERLVSASPELNPTVYLAAMNVLWYPALTHFPIDSPHYKPVFEQNSFTKDSDVAWLQVGTQMSDAKSRHAWSYLPWWQVSSSRLREGIPSPYTVDLHLIHSILG